MRRTVVGLAVLAAAAGGVAFPAQVPGGGSAGQAEAFTMRVVAVGLEAPWEIAWGPDGALWLTERTARRVVRLDAADGSRSTLVEIPEVHQSVGQDGLLGLALHPGLLRGTGNDHVFVAFTYDDAPGPALRRRLAVRRYRYDASSNLLTEPTDVLTGLPAHDDHVGGRLAIGPDGRLYLSIGDQGSNFGNNRCTANRAQQLPTIEQMRDRDWSAYQGKILRIDLDGGIPVDNPVLAGVRSHVFSYGHRNPLGLAFGDNGRLYASEHGPSTDDEVNLIEAGRNYGWPHVAGYRDDRAYEYANWSASAPEPCDTLPPGPVPPSVPSVVETAWSHPDFTPPLQTFFTLEPGEQPQGLGSATIAPGGLAFRSGGDDVLPWGDSLLALSLVRGTVYRLPLAADGRSLSGPPEELLQTANRYRDIAVGPDGRTVYLATDVAGPVRLPDGSRGALANPGAILAFSWQPPAE